MAWKALEARWPLFDIAVNATDAMYSGVYNERAVHEPDLDQILLRAAAVGVRGVLFTAGSAAEAESLVGLCGVYNAQCRSRAPRCLCTVGCHPTRCNEFLDDPDAYLGRLDHLLSSHSVHNGGCVAAVGEMGLDYDRLAFCTRDVQRTHLALQLQLAERHGLPLFLHDRNSQQELYDMLCLHQDLVRRVGGVVHSFTGTTDDLRRYLQLGLHIGINGCSLKTEENLQVVRHVPLSRLLLETDSPWCDVRRTHASHSLLLQAAARLGVAEGGALLEPYDVRARTRYLPSALVKGRNEPCNMVQLLAIVYELRRDEVDSIDALAAIIESNTLRLFPFTSNAEVK